MRVLLADDRVWLRSALRLLLEHESNVEVVGEVSHIRALPLFVSRLRPDLLFLDWQLSGLETPLARQKFMDTVRAIEPNLFIIALTNDEHNSGSHFFGVDAFINRAESPERILIALQHAASRKASSHDQSNKSMMI